MHHIADIEDRYPPRDARITTTLPLRPDDHRRLGQLALDLGLPRASIVRRALVAAGVLPATDTTNPEAAGE